MGVLVSLCDYREKLIENEIENLKSQLKQIIEKYDLYVENVPYFCYNLDRLTGLEPYMVYVSPPDFY